MKKLLISVLFALLYSNAAYTQADDPRGYPAKGETLGYPTISSDYKSYYGTDYNHIKIGNDIIPEPNQTNWTMYYLLDTGNFTRRQYSIINGDSIIGGKKYCITTIRRRDARAPYFYDDIKDRTIKPDTLLYRQEGDKVICRLPDETEAVILDYGLAKGDVFTDSRGEQFQVVDTGYFADIDPNIWYYEDKTPRMLRLQSLWDGSEDVWIEGIGSMTWGILPLSLAEQYVDFPSRPIKVRTIQAPGFNIIARICLNEDEYKLTYFEPEDHTPQGADFINYSFSGDTLCMDGKVPYMQCFTGYASCFIKEDTISVRVSYFSLMTASVPTCRATRMVHVRIPGFKAGTYHIGRFDESQEIYEYVTLECKGTDGIESIQNSKFKIDNNAPVYDLSGRRVSSSSSLKGVYIQGNKKIIKQ